MVRWIKTATVIVLGALAGAGTAVAVTGGSLGGGSLINHGWATDTTIGSGSANLWVAARVARVGLLALNRDETIYFDRTTDDTGAQLNERCSYIMTVPELPARWWSVTLYDRANMLAANSDNAPSFDASQAVLIAADPAVPSKVLIAPVRDPAADTTAFISSKTAGQFSLTLRLYNPEDTTEDTLKQLRLPSITRLDDCGREKGQ
jgi:hypothetical protein